MKIFLFVSCDIKWQYILQMDAQVRIKKKSILPSMFLYCVSHHLVNIKTVLLLYAETHHGQNKGDSMHSFTEPGKKIAEENQLPSQLSTIIKMACKHPRAYHAEDIQEDNILNYKEI